LLIKKGKSCIGSNRRGLEVDIPKDVIKCMKSIKHNFVLAGEAIGENVYCFDLISLKDSSYWDRYNTMIKMMGNQPNLLVVPTAWTEKDKRALLQRLRDENAEGIVFKHKDALYTAGRPESGGAQLKFKFKATASIIAGAVNKGKRSVAMWMKDQLGLVNVGNLTIYPNQTIPKKGEILEVEYLYAFKGGSIFQPVYLGPRDDIDEDGCWITQLKYKQEENQ